ncbi:MAG: Dabb family protein [Planctomycetaceae bacterium]
MYAQRNRWIAAALIWGAGLIMAASFSTTAAEPNQQDKLLRHIVLFKFKDDVTKDQVQEVADAFAALPKKIKEIADFEWGLENSPESLAQGFTHGFLVTFKSDDDRKAYLPHPEHLKFVELVGPRVEKVLVFDYWTKK